MSKSFNVAWKYLKSDSKSIWSVLWTCANFVWVCYFTFQIKGADKTAELIGTKIVIGLVPFLISLVALYIYHYLRSDLYIAQEKPVIGKSLIPGYLLKMVENWSNEPITALSNNNIQYNAYKRLERYRTSYAFEHIHPQIDEFLEAFQIEHSLFVHSIKTKFSSNEEALADFPRLKSLALTIGYKLT